MANKISLEISKAINSNIEFVFKTDKSLISGIKIQVGSLLIDTSLSNKLRRIKNGKITIEGTLDLHGLSLKDAESRLRLFVGNSLQQKKGCC